MNSPMRMFFVAGLLVPLTTGAAPRDHGTGQTGSACSQKVLPLAVGNQWTYSLVPSPTPADVQIARIAPPAPNSVVITVKAIDSGPGGNTVITLEEKSVVAGGDNRDTASVAGGKPDASGNPGSAGDERTITTTITCGTTKFELSPDSFWFAGEPGGAWGFQLGTVNRPKGTSFALTNGRLSEEEWREDLITTWTRVPYAGSDAKPASGKLEVERRFTPQQPETVRTKLGSYRAEKLGLITTGRVTLDSASRTTKPTELPAGWLSTLWIAEGTGVVQTVNPFARMYQLTAITLK